MHVELSYLKQWLCNYHSWLSWIEQRIDDWWAFLQRIRKKNTSKFVGLCFGSTINSNWTEKMRGKQIVIWFTPSKFIHWEIIHMLYSTSGPTFVFFCFRTLQAMSSIYCSIFRLIYHFLQFCYFLSVFHFPFMYIFILLVHFFLRGMSISFFPLSHLLFCSIQTYFSHFRIRKTRSVIFTLPIIPLTHKQCEWKIRRILKAFPFALGANKERWSKNEMKMNWRMDEAENIFWIFCFKVDDSNLQRKTSSTSIKWECICIDSIGVAFSYKPLCMAATAYHRPTSSLLISVHLLAFGSARAASRSCFVLMLPFAMYWLKFYSIEPSYFHESV